MCCDALAKGPDIADVSPWSARPGVELTFSTGARIWLAVTTVGAGAASTPSEARTPPQLLPKLVRRDQTISLIDAEIHLAAVLHGAGNPQIRSAYAYSDHPVRPRTPGVGLLLTGGARAYLPVVHTARAGQNPGRRPYEQLQERF